MRNDFYQHLENFKKYFPNQIGIEPWDVITHLQQTLRDLVAKLDENQYTISGDVAIHKSATVEQHVVLKGPLIITENCFIGAHAYFRGGVFLGNGVSVGPGCEVKTCIILDRTVLAHFNFAGDSIIGSHVNMEAGSILANHHNDRTDKTILMVIEGAPQKLPVTKFGSLICDHVKIGANAVCSPGTYLAPSSIVKRLALVEQT